MLTDETTDKIIEDLSIKYDMSAADIKILLSQLINSSRNHMLNSDVGRVRWQGLGSFSGRLTLVRHKLRTGMHFLRKIPKDRSRGRMDYMARLNRARNRLMLEKAARSHKYRKEYNEWLKNKQC